MKISEAIEVLQKLQFQHGDIELRRYGARGFPEKLKFSVAYIRPPNGRERNPQWVWRDDEKPNATKVIRG